MNTGSTLTPLSPLPEPPSRTVGAQQRFDEMAYQSLKGQQKMVGELNNGVIPAFNAALPAINDAFVNRVVIHAAAGNAIAAAESARRAEDAREATIAAHYAALTAIRTERAEAVATVILEGDRQTARVAGTGDTWLNRMANEADRATREADRAEEAANAIPGLAENRTVFQGYRVEGAYLVRYTPEATTETVSANTFDAFDVLPVLSGWRIDTNGHLVLETGFQA